MLILIQVINIINCNKMCAMFSLFTEFITEFESTWGIVLKQFFAEGKGEIIE